MTLRPSCKYLILAIESWPIQELTLDYVTSKLSHEVSRQKENESRDDGAAFYAKQIKGANCESDNNRATIAVGRVTLPNIVLKRRTMR